ncbi:MAG: ribose-phosphate pyrophosphokinase-like domain-containing protein, partial [Candidatus Altimarinota bacterium]
MSHRFSIVAGTSHPQLAEDISRELGVPLTQVEIKQFASREIYVRLHETVRGREVFVI